jgi:hypothetical protein
MATHRIPIIGSTAVPDDTGECYFERSDVLTTNGRWPMVVVRFGSAPTTNPAVIHGFYGSFIVPKNYVGSAVLVWKWSTALTAANNAIWEFEYRAVADTQSIDQTSQDEQITNTDADSATANIMLEDTGALTSGNFAVDDLVQYYFSRDALDANDTVAGAAYLPSLEFEYADA